MKPCPTCGREIADAATVCDSCEAWAAALVETPSDDAKDRAPEVPANAGDAPVAAAPATAAPARAVSRRQMTLIAAGVGVVALTGFAMAARGRPSPAPAPAAAAAAPAPRVNAPATAAPPAAAPPTTETAPVQSWSTANQFAWLENPRRGAAFELLSENVVKTAFGALRPSLVIRCTAQRIEAFVVPGAPMKIDPRVDGKTVAISVDGEPARTEQWADSDRRTEVFAPDPAAFTARLRTARTLRFGYSPHNSGDVVAEFHVAGLDALLGASAKHCGPAK